MVTCKWCNFFNQHFESILNFDRWKATFSLVFRWEIMLHVMLLEGIFSFLLTWSKCLGLVWECQCDMDHFGCHAISSSPLVGGWVRWSHVGNDLCWYIYIRIWLIKRRADLSNSPWAGCGLFFHGWPRFDILGWYMNGTPWAYFCLKSTTRWSS